MRVVLEDRLPMGLCAGVELERSDGTEPEVLARLAPGERAHAATLAPRRRRTWVAGRFALRAALRTWTGTEPDAILADDRGAPRLPPGVAGSISHKDDFAVAIVADAAAGTLGIDVENLHPRTTDIASHVLTQAEQLDLVGLADDARSLELLRRFSLKEALYKALDPQLRRYIAFQEVEVARRPDGTADFRALPPDVPAGTRVEACWLEIPGPRFVSVVRARFAPEPA